MNMTIKNGHYYVLYKNEMYENNWTNAHYKKKKIGDNKIF